MTTIQKLMDNKFVRNGSLAVATMGTTAMANADAFAVPAEVTAAAVSVGLVGAAVFAIHVAVKLYKWITGAL